MGTIQEGAPKERKLPNWIDSFLAYTAALPSPEIYRKWAGISLVSSVMERKVWALTRNSQLFPNLYILLVGPPGTGKSAVISRSERLLRTVKQIHLAPSSVTTASLCDALVAAERRILVPTQTPNFMQFNSLLILASEFGVFLPSYETSYINLLTKLYDGELYEERRRTGRVTQIRIDHTLLSILGGTQPAFLQAHLPDVAWDQGFTSRTILIFSDEPIKTDIFNFKTAELDALYNKLAEDLNIIAALYGEFTWTQSVQKAIRKWNDADCPPIPMHAKLAHYCSRRLAHVLKLCMIANAARCSNLIVDTTDFEQAKSWLLEAESVMPEIFNAMGASTDGRAMEDCWHYLTQIHKEKPIPEYVLVDFLRSRLQAHQIIRAIEIMIRSNMVKPSIDKTGSSYTPNRNYHKANGRC